MKNFKDNFSKHSAIYAKYRPQYPVELYEYLASLTPGHDLSWDCGTGNGQAAIGLSNYYKKIFATDPSEQQIKNCIPHKGVTYAVEKAEQTTLQSNTVDLVTVANALHWFDFSAFYKEAKRVLKKDGILAAWAYKVPTISPELDKIIRKFHDEMIDPYWQPENRMIEKEYAEIPFPFTEIKTPKFYIKKKMSLQEFCGFLNTWSATQRFIQDKKYNPIDQLEKQLLSFWNDDSEKEVSWELVLKVGRV